MNKLYQQEELRKMLMNPSHCSGLYLIDTDLSDEEIEECIRATRLCSYEKERLIPTSEGSAFELLVAGLSFRCDDHDICWQRDNWLQAKGRQKDVVLYSLIISILRRLCTGDKCVLHLHGERELDMTVFTHEELCKFEASLMHHKVTTLVIGKKNVSRDTVDSVIKRISFIEKDKYRLMENRLDKVHISYKHDDKYAPAFESIKRGLAANGIPFSIDEYDIMYRGNIEEYEREIGASGRVIMFVIPSYLRSLDCMYEMTQMFKNGNIKERIFPVVDLGGVPRNGDGLKQTKDFWLSEKVRKAEQIKAEPGCSTFVIGEIQKIDEILKVLDDLWDYLVHVNTGKYEKLIENDADQLIEELKKTLPKIEASIDRKLIPSDGVTPPESRTVIQNGEKSLNIGNNYGSIIIN